MGSLFFQGKKVFCRQEVVRCFKPPFAQVTLIYKLSILKLIDWGHSIASVFKKEKAFLEMAMFVNK
jgi:hypothetical protein